MPVQTYAPIIADAWLKALDPSGKRGPARDLDRVGKVGKPQVQPCILPCCIYLAAFTLLHFTLPYFLLASFILLGPKVLRDFLPNQILGFWRPRWFQALQ